MSKIGNASKRPVDVSTARPRARSVNDIPIDELQLIGPAAVPDVGPDVLFRKELEAYGAFDDDDERLFERRLKLAVLQRELRQFDTMIRSRESYANKIFKLLVFWLIGLGVFLGLHGFHIYGFELDAKVLLTLIGGTTLNILGIFTIVANFLFPKTGPAAFFSALSKKAVANEQISSAPAKKTRTRRAYKDVEAIAEPAEPTAD